MQKRLNDACLAGDFFNVISALDDGAIITSDVIRSACMARHNDIVKTLLSLSNTFHGGGYAYLMRYTFSNACIAGNIDIMNYTYSDNNRLLNLSVESCDACISGDIQVLEWFLAHNVYDWNRFLYGACRGGHLNMIQKCIDNRATNWDCGLRGACKGGNLEIVKDMVKRGANNIVSGLENAYRERHLHIIEYLNPLVVEHNWDGYLLQASAGGHLDLVKLTIEQGATNLYGALSIAKSKDVALHLIISGADISSCDQLTFSDIEYLIKSGVTTFDRYSSISDYCIKCMRSDKHFNNYQLTTVLVIIFRSVRL